MSEYTEYPKEVWDYFSDMPYMPSRLDRDRLLEAGDKRHVQIWDYFFQIDPNDVGMPQKKEISDIDIRLSEEIIRYNNRQNEIRNTIKDLVHTVFLMRLKNALLGLVGFVLSGVLLKFILGYSLGLNLVALILSPFILYSLIMWASVGFVGMNEKRQIKELRIVLVRIRDNNNLYVRKEVKRKSTLIVEIETLKSQIPIALPGATIRSWLNEDLHDMQDHAIEVTGLGTRLVDCGSGVFDEDGNSVLQQNPIPVLGPAELQSPQKIPKLFSKKVNPDLNSHLHARRSYIMLEQDKIDVLYGVYYLEYILIGDDMLATCGLFFDFINGKTFSEQIIEQYYEDVVAIAIAKEFRKIVLNNVTSEIVSVEDAPTFTLSLASGEQRTVTFVSEKYFMQIRDKIDVDQDAVLKIFWIRNSRQTADDAMAALRYYVRLHKARVEEE